MNRIFAILLTACLSGCGTLTSLSQSDQEISAKLSQKNTHCKTTSRAYGGVSYDLCRMHSDPKSEYIDWYWGFYLLDTTVTAMADTVVLPYTIFQQAKKGSIVIKQ